MSTSALVDGQLLIDFGPDTPRQAEALGVDLRRVRNVLVAHPDHLAPAGLLWRRWAAGDTAPVTVYGPAPVMDEVVRWFGEDPRLRARAVAPGDELHVGEHVIRVLAATHEVETVLYDVTDDAGARLLYATDTGPLPAATITAVAGRAFDVALIEQTFGRVDDHGTGHLDLTTFPRTLADLRAVGALTAATQTLAVHLSHHNPPEQELAAVVGRRARARRRGRRGALGCIGRSLSARPGTPPTTVAASRRSALGQERAGRATPG